MRKKSIVMIMSVIGLSSFVVLGSSTDFVFRIIDSVKSNSVTRDLFRTQNTGPNAPKTSQRSSLTPEEYSLDKDQSDSDQVPEAVVWSVIFSLPKRLDTEADRARAVGEDDSLWTKYFVRQSKISAASNQILRETAEHYFLEIAPIDEQAISIIRELREKNPQPPALSPYGSFLKEPVPASLSILQIQKNEAVLRNRDLFRTAIGEQEYAKFSNFIETEFSKGFIPNESLSKEPSLRTEDETEGFTPFGTTETGGKQ